MKICIHHVIAMPFIVLSTMSGYEEAGVTSPFSEIGPNLEEGELEIDEGVTEEGVSLDSPFVPSL